MSVDERDDAGDDFDEDRAAERDTAPGAAEDTADEEPQPLARVRYGLGKELLLFADALVVHLREEREETRYHLASMRRLILMPGEHNPAKLVLMVELDDGTTVIAAEGVSNVRAFRVLLARLREIAPTLELDPEDMDEQLGQALDIRKRYSLGCYGAVLGSCLLLWIVYLVVAFIGAHGPR